jgi:hypothetical protein
MAATTASTASARIESRRWPPDFISPGPRVSAIAQSRVRAITASAPSRTSSARARVIAPSSALGQRRYSASATIMVDDAVAEEFQALVVRRTGAAMRQRLRQQRGSRSGDRSGRPLEGISGTGFRS